MISLMPCSKIVSWKMMNFILSKTKRVDKLARIRSMQSGNCLHVTVMMRERTFPVDCSLFSETVSNGSVTSSNTLTLIRFSSSSSWIAIAVMKL